MTERYRLERVSLSRGEALAVVAARRRGPRGARSPRSRRRTGSTSRRRRSTPCSTAPSADVERLVLAVAWRHRLPPPPADVLRRLASSPSPRVRRSPSRFLAAPARPEAPDDLVRLARAVRSDGELPAWTGPVEAGWGRQALLAQRAPGQVPGTTLRFMRTERFRGRPYVLHVPDDYRGDEPFPLVVVLGGGPGRAIPTAQTARATLEPRGELAVFPQANGMWWEDEPAAAFEALLAEVARRAQRGHRPRDDHRLQQRRDRLAPLRLADAAPLRRGGQPDGRGPPVLRRRRTRSTRPRSPASRSSSSTATATT